MIKKCCDNVILFNPAALHVATRGSKETRQISDNTTMNNIISIVFIVSMLLFCIIFLTKMFSTFFSTKDDG